ncbi:MAG: hypothetical protein HY861_03365 [Chlamydiia bacterium]|nr:hypothetical protein [Chlamydiia bacterium]
MPPAQPAPLGRKPSGPPVQSRVAWSEDAPAPAPAPAPVVVHGRKQLNRHSVVQVAPEKPDSAAPDTRSKPVDPSTIPTTGTPRRRASSVEERQTEAAQQMKQQEARKVRDAALKQKRAPVNKKTETE